MNKYFDKERIKGVFDNLRNVSLAALLLVIGVRIMELKPDHWFQIYYFGFIGLLLAISSIGLFFLNAKHAIEVLSPDNLSESSIFKRLLVGLVFVVYLLSVAPVYSYIVVDQAQNSVVLDKTDES